MGEDNSRVMFLAAMPRAADAEAWVVSQRKSPNHPSTATFPSMMFALVSAEGDQRRIYGFYDSIPEDSRLIDDMTAALEGAMPEIASFDARNGRSDFARLGAPFTLDFIASQGSLAMAGLANPGERAFKSLSDGSVTATKSGLRCPVLPGYQRVELVLTGGTGAEAGCRYASERSRIAVFATSMPEADFKTIFQIMLAPSLAADDAAVPSPTVVPAQERSLLSASFTSKDGARSAFWGFKRKDWAYEIYALYGRGGDAAVAAAATALLTANPAAK